MSYIDRKIRYEIPSKKLDMVKIRFIIFFHHERITLRFMENFGLIYEIP